MKYQRETVLALLFICFLNFKCKTDIESKTISSKKEEQIKGVKLVSNYVIVLADFSTSADSNTILFVNNNIKNILYMLPSKTRILVYPISDETVSKPILDYTVTLGGNRHQEREKNKKLHEDMLKKFEDSLFYGNRIINLNQNRPTSCIYNSLLFADTQFRTLNNRDTTNNCKYYIYLLSDMIEECESSSINDGKVYLHHGTIISLRNISSNKFKKGSLDYINLNIVYSSSQSGFTNTRYYTKNELEYFWENLLLNSGFNPLNIKNQFPFSPTPKDFFKKKVNNQ